MEKYEKYLKGGPETYTDREPTILEVDMFDAFMSGKPYRVCTHTSLGVYYEYYIGIIESYIFPTNYPSGEVVVNILDKYGNIKQLNDVYHVEIH